MERSGKKLTNLVERPAGKRKTQGKRASWTESRLKKKQAKKKVQLNRKANRVNGPAG